MTKKSSQTSKSYRLGYILFHSSLPDSIKQAWRRLLPTMRQEELSELLQLLEKEEKLQEKMKIACNNEWKRMEMEHEMQMGVIIKGLGNS